METALLFGVFWVKLYDQVSFVLVKRAQTSVESLEAKELTKETQMGSGLPVSSGNSQAMTNMIAMSLIQTELRHVRPHN